MKNKLRKIKCATPTIGFILGVFLFFSCENKEPVTNETVDLLDLPESHLLGGGTTVQDKSRKAFTLSARNLAEEHKSSFFVGNSLFNKNWVQAPASAKARDGLGPLFIARSCSGCHIQDGRGRPPVLDEDYVSLLFRLSVKEEDGTFHAHRELGDQLQIRSLSDEVIEPKVSVRYETVDGQFADGSRYSLEKPLYSINTEDETIVVSPRVAQSVIGLGLFEAIPESQLYEWSDPLDENEDGISGRVNLVKNRLMDCESVGRFGWKANQPDVYQQVAAAFNGDLGITSSLFPAENYSSIQGEKLTEFPSGGSPEISDKLLKDVVLYCQTLAVPSQRDYRDTDVQAGEKVFHQIHCTACHVSQVTTGDHPIKALANQHIRPFTDLLLHDMGEGLADGRPDSKATGREWRTAPLWGIGLVKSVNHHTRFLHDGRARNIEEAILWHGGEAKSSQEAYLKLSKHKRSQLLKFLESL